MGETTKRAAESSMTWATRPGWYERLARRYYAGVYNYMRWLCHDPDLAHDLTQATFVQVWRHPPEFRGDAALRAWVHRVARNEYLQHHCRASVETVPLDDGAEAEMARSMQPDGQAQAEARELREVVRGAVGRLPDTFREVVVLHNMEGLSLGEVAEVLGVPTGTVKSRRAKAFALLREMLSAEVKCNEMQPNT